MRILRAGAGLLRLRLVAPLLALLAACEQRGDAGWYAYALAEAPSYEDAAAACRRIDARSTREDCLLAVLESHDRLAEADCGELQDPVWHDECLFQLAERRRAAGDLAEAIRTCHRTRFSRPCAWHLLQDEVQASIDLPAPEAEARLQPFAAADPLPDAAFQFWMIRFREQGTRGRTVDEADCASLQDPSQCRRALQSHIHRMLEALGNLDLQKTCAREPGTRANVRGAPAWVLGSLALETERQWEAEFCPAREAAPPAQ